MYDRALTAAELRSHYAVMTGANQDFNRDGVGDLFSTATGTLTIWNGKGANKFGIAQSRGSGWAGYFETSRHHRRPPLAPGFAGARETDVTIGSHGAPGIATIFGT
ncbi:hypothetical protein [Nonomuraea sp. SBT364]|uniref:hypothetical protein n=1 Tax=Nonomuraea sp. SBT364 TaxID=1580530 RepID=UPI00066B325B|nr:hypothetical protein [Nonomuraea sp. SBT364]